MKAIGAKGSHIMIMFVLEILILGLLGSFLGIALGTYLSLSLSEIFNLLKDVSANLTVNERVKVGMIGLLVGTGICMIGAISSIIRIKKLEPYSVMKEA
jgi:putative ABC transport system permease protein